MRAGPGRVLLELPTDYRRQLGAAAAGWTDRQRALAEQLLKRAANDGRFRRRAGQGVYDAAAGWVANAVAEHQRERLRAIVSRDGRPPDVIADDEATDDAEPFRVPRTMAVRRTPADLAAAVASLLHLGGGDVHFVDQYLLKQDRRTGEVYANPNHQEVLREMLRVGRVRNPVHYHALRYDGFDLDRCRLALRGTMPDAGQPLTLWLWPAFALHNRFVLAGRGGVQFGHGLDRRRFEDGATDDVTLLDGEHWRQRLAEFEAAGSRGAMAHPVPTERDRRRAAMRGSGSSLNIPVTSGHGERDLREP